MTASDERSPSKSRLPVLVGFVALLWIVFLVDLVLPGELTAYGVRPREVRGLLGILFMPFVHGDLWHLVSNTLPLLVLGWFVLLRGVTEFVEVTIVVAGLGGLGTWTIGGASSLHVGASGVVFGYLGYLLWRGWLERSFFSLAVAVIVGLFYGGALWGVLPGKPGISWEGHLCGLLAGAACAWLMVRFGGDSEK